MNFHQHKANGNSMGKAKQGGFTLVELAVVTIIISIIAAFAYPRVNSYVISNRTPDAGKDIANGMLLLKANADGTGATPYTTVATSTLANAMRDRSNVYTVAGAGAAATMVHSVGATGSQVTVAPATITTLGDSYAVTMPTVNNGACPGLAAIARNAAQIITINGVVVKSIPAAVEWNGQAAQDACTQGDTNAFVFTAR